ncbi:hypothetical protein OIDMADRAFT_27700 [Oidiodendron maius Zn]|uniref:Ferric reductase NAD binding domain-containing protein n=1 Tax=Oidiodendron maius (strain Zn) TaxID=913774 RepID=A0A0C3H515_OIDMZ|nr:hypothetical protein OIDMADRAFT_27700 [Oidiodendron maius Zn]
MDTQSHVLHPANRWYDEATSSEATSSFCATTQCGGIDQPPPAKGDSRRTDGSKAPVGKYGTVLYLAGGSGITAILPYIREFATLHPATPSPLHDPNGRQADILTVIRRHFRQKVHLIWVVREMKFAQHIWQQHLSDAQHRDQNLLVQIYITLRQNETSDNETFRFQRPQVNTLMEGEIENTSGIRGERLAGFVCGPERMADDARKTIAQAVKEGVDHVQLYEEVFGW